MTSRDKETTSSFLLLRGRSQVRILLGVPLFQQHSIRIYRLKAPLFSSKSAASPFQVNALPGIPGSDSLKLDDPNKILN